MLRATNVPMKWDNYDDRATWAGRKYPFPDIAPVDRNPVNYQVEVFGEPVNSAYLYRVDVTEVPTAVCKRIINMNPTAVDLIKVGAAAQPGASGAMATAADCENANEITDMSFYFIPNFGGENPVPGPVPEVCDPACGDDECCNNGVCEACENPEPVICDESKKTSPCDECVDGVWVYPCIEKCQVCDEESKECKVEADPGCSAPKVALTDEEGCFTGGCGCPNGTDTLTGACCTGTAPESCPICKSPEIVNGCYTGECIADESLTYDLWGEETSCGEDICVCVERQLYYCSTGKASFTICCDPKDPECSSLDCKPNTAWKKMDKTGQGCSIVETTEDFSNRDIEDGTEGSEDNGTGE
jgi:hypothetical protein